MSLLNDGKHIALAHDEIFFTFHLKLRAGILAIKHGVTILQYHRIILGAITGGNNLATLWLFLCRIRNNNSTYFFLSWRGLYQHSVC